MATDTAETVLITSVLSTFRFFVVLGVGYVASRRPKREPLLTTEVCRNLSRVGMDLFFPCLLLASTGSTLNPAALQDSWHLVAGSTLSIGLSNVVASAFGWLLMRPDARATFRPVQMAIAFPNALVFPLVLLNALCEQDVINSDYDGDSVECYGEATGMIFIYVAVWEILFFAWGFYCLKNDNALELSLTNLPTAKTNIAPDDPENPAPSSTGYNRQPQAAGSPLHQSQNRVVTVERGADTRASTPPVVSADVSPSLPPQHTATTNNANGGDGREGVANGAVSMAVATNQVAGPLGTEDDANIVVGSCGSGGGSEHESKGGLWTTARQRAWEVVKSPVILALAAGIVICMIAPLQEMLFLNPLAFLRPLGGAVQAVGVPAVTVITLVMAGSLGAASTAESTAAVRNMEKVEGMMPIWRRPRFIMGASLIVLRLVTIPAALFGLFWLAKTRSSVMGETRLMHLILLIQFAMPSASLMISVLSQMRMPSTARFITRLLVWQFAASSITVSFWTALAINMLY